MTGQEPVSGSSASTSFSLTNNAVLTWTWKTQYELSAAADTGGSVSPETGWYDEDGPVTVTATPDTGYHFAGWRGDTLGDTNLVDMDLTMDQARSITAAFTLNDYTITASAGTGGSIDPSGAVSVSHGGDQAFTITADAHYHIDDVLVDSASVGAVSSHTIEDVTEDGHTIEASFAIDEHTLEVVSTHGTGTPAVGIHTYDYNTALTPSVTSPDTAGSTRYVCTGWTMTGQEPVSGSSASTSFSLTNNAVLTWSWKTQYQWTVSINPSGGGSATPASGTWYDTDDAFTAYAQTNAGWSFTSWSGDLSGTTTNADVVMSGAISATANFTLIDALDRVGTIFQLR